jgi:hypothetical protein
MKPRTAKRSLAPFMGGLCSGALLAQAAFAQVAPPEAQFAGRWVHTDAVLALRLTPQQQARWREWRFFIGTREVTALARLATPGLLELVPGAARWPSGESELVVHEGEAGAEVARLPLRVLSALGFEASEHQPRLDIGGEGRAADRRSDGQPTSARTGQADGTLGAGHAWKGRRDEFNFEAAANLAGHSQQDKALRFATLAERAPKTDLADYRLALGWREHGIELGHLSAGTHPLLVQGFASRGVGIKSRLGAQADLTVHALRGSAIVGYDELSGLADDEHRLHLLTLGSELLADRPGGLRLELSLADAAVRAQSGFEVGSVPDAERSSGLGLRLAAASADARLGGELALARSRFTNPFDPALALGGELKPVQPVTRHALAARLRWAAVQGLVLGAAPAAAGSTDTPHAQEAPGANKLDLSFELQHDRAQPLYRSLGGNVTPDQQATRVTAQLGLAGAALQANAGTRVDNLARIATLLRTRTDEAGTTLALPLPAWFATPQPAAGSAAPAGDSEPAQQAKPASPWPALTLAGKWLHQRALNAPAAEDSGVAATHRPDQVTREQQLNLNWTLGVHGLSYGASRSTLDNRQSGRERADFRRLAHQASLNLMLGEAWRAALALSRARQASIETGLVNWTTGGSLQLDWTPGDRWAVSASAKHELADDSLDRARNAGDGAQLQITRRFALPGIDKPLPGQVFVRLGYQAQRQRDAVFASATRFRAGWVDTGLSFSFF